MGRKQNTKGMKRRGEWAAQKGMKEEGKSGTKRDVIGDGEERGNPATTNFNFLNRKLHFREAI